MRRAPLAIAFALLSSPFALPGCLPDTTAAGDAGDFDALSGDANVDLDFDAGGAADTGGGGQDSSVPPSDAGPDSTLPLPDSGSDAATDAPIDAPPVDAGTVSLRFVNLAPDLGTAVDLCASVNGFPLQGPFLKGAGVTAGLAYGQMTQYFSVPAAGAYHVRVVAANAPNCATALLPDATGVAASTGYATVALMGSSADAGGHAPALRALLDDAPTGFPGYGAGARLRLLHAAPLSPPTDVVIGAGSCAVAQQSAVPYGAVSSATTQSAGGATTDANGYFVQPLFTAQMTLHHTTDVTSFVTGPSQNGFSVFFVGLAGSPTTPEGVLACNDTAAPNGFLTPCTLETSPPTLTPMRVNQSAPVLGTTDVCFQIGTGPIIGPLLQAAGVSAGLPYLSLSGQVATVPTDTELTLYFPAPAAPCTGGGPVAEANAAFPYLSGVTDEVLLLSNIYNAGNVQPYATPTLSGGFLPADTSPLLFRVVDYDDFGSFGASLKNFDILVSPADGGAEQLLVPDVPPISADFGASLAPGSYSMRFADEDGGTTEYTLTGLAIVDGGQTMVSVVDTSPTTLVLTRCDLGMRDAGTVTTCSQ